MHYYKGLLFWTQLKIKILESCINYFILIVEEVSKISCFVFSIILWIARTAANNFQIYNFCKKKGWCFVIFLLNEDFIFITFPEFRRYRLTSQSCLSNIIDKWSTSYRCTGCTYNNCSRIWTVMWHLSAIISHKLNIRTWSYASVVKWNISRLTR